MNKKNEKHDVVIIGGGVAGLSAALWCDDLGLSALILEKEKEFGGQLLKVYNPIENYLGITAKNGTHLRDIFLRQIEGRKFIRNLETEAARIDLENKKIILKSGEELAARAVIIATGVRRRKLNIENEDFYGGKGIIESGKNEQQKVSGKIVLIAGGGDAALENALILAETAKKVYLAHRRKTFRARAEFLEKARNNPKIEFFTETSIQKICGDGKIMKAVELKNLGTSEIFELKIDHLLIRIGVEPNAELFHGKLHRDESGYLKTDANGETNIKLVFAAGDVAFPFSPTVSTAAGAAATAVKTIFARFNSLLK